MKVVFADTAFYIALLRRPDELHRRAVDFDRGYSDQYLTSEFVFMELGNWLSNTAQRRHLGEFVRRMRTETRTTVLPASPEWFQRGLDLYSGRPDKQWSLIDCISFEMMREHHVVHALTHDHHFQQAGFEILLG